MQTLFAALMFISSVFLILLVLVQRGRGGGLSGAFGGMGGQSAFGAKAGDTFTRVTVVAATVWIVLCMLATGLLSGGDKNESILTQGGDDSVLTQPAGDDANPADDLTADPIGGDAAAPAGDAPADDAAAATGDAAAAGDAAADSTESTVPAETTDPASE